MPLLHFILIRTQCLRLYKALLLRVGSLKPSQGVCGIFFKVLKLNLPIMKVIFIRTLIIISLFDCSLKLNGLKTKYNNSKTGQFINNVRLESSGIKRSW